jgi:DNA ligase-1
LLDFATANDAAAATSRKLEKQKVIGEFLRTLADDDELRRAVRFAGGRAFAATDERVIGVSSATVRDVLSGMFGIDPIDWRARTVRNGEVGEAMAELWGERADAVDPGEGLTLGDLQETFDALARVGQPEMKRDLLRDLFARLRAPREAAYAGKIIFGDLRTGVREGVLQSAVAEAFGREADAVRRAVLLTGDLGDVAVMARHDRLGEATFRLFHPIGFMLAVPQETADQAAGTVAATGRGWLAEHKLDGIRCQIHKQGTGGLARVNLFSRTLDRSDDSFPDVVGHARTLPGDWLLDGEIVPYDDAAERVTAFANVQKRLGRKHPDAATLRKYPCRFVAFDLLYRDGRTLLDEPLSIRRAQLLDLLGHSDQVLTLDATEVDSTATIEQAFETSRAARNEGLILKDPTTPYLPGRRGKAWLKLKTHLPTLDVVVTAAEHGHGKRRNHLSDYTFAVWQGEPGADGELVNVGKAFSGVTDEEIDKLTELFLEIQTAQHGRVYTVRPQVVFEVAFDAIQQSKRHRGGFALRFPRIKRIRWDRTPESADRIERVREIFEAEANFNRDDASDREQQLSLF